MAEFSACKHMKKKKVLLHIKNSIGADFRFDVPGQSSVGLIGGGRGQWLGGTMASAEHEPIMGVWGQKPPEAESILVMNVQRSRQI